MKGEDNIMIEQNDILEPVKLYKLAIKDAHHQNALEYFDKLDVVIVYGGRNDEISQNNNFNDKAEKLQNPQLYLNTPKLNFINRNKLVEINPYSMKQGELGECNLPPQ